jgi:uncharacterized protein (AIM24 family)
MRQSEGPFGNEPVETESKRLTPSIGLAHDSDKPTDSSNEDFLFHLYRGSELLQDNRVHEAKEELERALHLQPRDTKGQDLLAVVYFRLGLYARAIQIYEQLRRRNTNDTALLLNLALCYLKTGQPQLARRDLEHLLTLNPNHARAWGYLGLACERLADLPAAERAFRQGGHAPMAKRIAARREAGSLPPAHTPPPQPTKAVREVADAAYQELDAGELSFALAEPTSEKQLDAASENWQPIEQRTDTRKPDTRDGPPIAPSVPQLGLSQSLNRRPTLIAPIGAPPAHELGELSVRIPSQKSPSIGLDDARGSVVMPSLRRPVVAVPSPFGPSRSVDLQTSRGATLPPPGPASVPPADRPRGVQTPLGMGPVRPEPADREDGPPSERATSSRTKRAPSAAQMRASAPKGTEPVRFPERGAILHSSGVVLVHTRKDAPFVARLEAIRAQQSGLEVALLERHVKGKPTGESFGGLASPMAMVSGEGQLVLGPRAGRKLTEYAVASGEMCFAREDVLLGFDGALAFENGRLTSGEGEQSPVVQLRGTGSVLFEAFGEILTIQVHAERSLSVRREVVLGWFGRLVPRAIAPADAPCGQRGLVGFAGEGRVLVASA